MKNFARIFLLLTGVLLLAHYLPAAFWLIADQRQRVPTVFYSCLEKNFLLFRSERGEIVRTDRQGKTYDRDEFERLLPLDNYLQLYKDGRMPKEIDGVAITPEKLRRERVNVRLKPEVLDTPSVALTPLLETESGRVRLEMPGDFMRLGATIEFVDAKSNRLLPEKSVQFQRAFAAAGFAFPVKLVGSNPTTLKPYDEGCFLVDAKDVVFRLRQIRGEAELVRLVELAPTEQKTQWAELQPRYIHVQEQDNREIHALIIGRDNRAHLVVGNEQRLVTLPLKKFDPATMQLTVRGDLLNRLVVVSSAEYVEAVALNRDYSLLDRYTEMLVARAGRPSGQLAGALFPFTLDLESDTSGFLGFNFEWGNRWVIVLNAILLAALVGWAALRKQAWRLRMPDLVAVAGGGVFGLITVLVLPKTE
ncbi:MAG: DUF4857 domain-containing protein [Verrucomicrobiota bacterium]